MTKETLLEPRLFLKEITLKSKGEGTLKLSCVTAAS